MKQRYQVDYLIDKVSFIKDLNVINKVNIRSYHRMLTWSEKNITKFFVEFKRSQYLLNDENNMTNKIGDFD